MDVGFEISEEGRSVRFILVPLSGFVFLTLVMPMHRRRDLTPPAVPEILFDETYQTGGSANSLSAFALSSRRLRNSSKCHEDCKTVD